jgi:hypothetical protein
MKPRIYIPLLLLAYVLLRRAIFTPAPRCSLGYDYEMSAEWIDRLNEELTSDRSADA